MEECHFPSRSASKGVCPYNLAPHSQCEVYLNTPEGRFTITVTQTCLLANSTELLQEARSWAIVKLTTAFAGSEIAAMSGCQLPNFEVLSKYTARYPCPC